MNAQWGSPTAKELRIATAMSCVTQLSREISVPLPLRQKFQEPQLFPPKNIPVAYESRLPSESLAAASRRPLSGVLPARSSCSALPDSEKSSTIGAPGGARLSLPTRLLEPLGTPDSCAVSSALRFSRCVSAKWKIATFRQNSSGEGVR